MKDDGRFDPNVLARMESKVGAGRVSEIILLFLEHAPPRLKIVLGGEGHDYLDSSAAALHSIKSSAAMLGASELMELAARMERLAMEENGDALRELLGDLEKAFAAAVGYLREHANGLAP